MSRWIGLCDPLDSQFDPNGVAASNFTGRSIASTDATLALMARGTLVFEATLKQSGPDCNLIQVQRGDAFHLEVAVISGRRLTFRLGIAGQEWQHSLAVTLEDGEAILRISYAWDTVARVGLVSVYQPRCGHFAQTLLKHPRPFRSHDLRALFADNLCLQSQVGLDFLALSTEFEAAGPMPTLSGGTVIETADGPKQLRNLTPHDPLILADGRQVCARAIVRRELPTRGSFQPIRLTAPYFGLSRDMTVSRSARLTVSGPDVEYLLGLEHVMVEAGHLLDGRSVYAVDDVLVAPYYQIILDTPDVLAGSPGLETLDLSPVAQSAMGRSSSLIAQLEEGFQPNIYKSALHLARKYEVTTLNQARAA